MGVLTTIQRFSLHDGPGIRSTVFFKGCNMRCKWCHNPETLTMSPEVLYYKIKCVGCGACAAVCEGHSVVDGKMLDVKYFPSHLMPLLHIPYVR